MLMVEHLMAFICVYLKILSQNEPRCGVFSGIR